MTSRADKKQIGACCGVVILACGLSAARAGAETAAAAPAPQTAASAAMPNAVADSQPEPQVEQARQAFLLGTALAGQGQWPEALAAFERSSKLRPHPVTTYNVAYCERAVGHYTRAYKLFQQSLAEHQAAQIGTLPDELLALARGYLPEVEHRLARVLVRMEPPEASLSVDGRPLEVMATPASARPVLLSDTRDERGSDRPPAPEFELLVDPGRHVFAVTPVGAPEKVVEEAFEPGASRELFLDARPAPPPVAPKPKAPPAAVQASVSEPSSRRTWAYVSYGAGGAGLVVWSVFGILGLAKKGHLDSVCTDGISHCDRKYQGDIDTMNRDLDIATVGLGVTVLGAGLGTYLLVTSPSASPKRDSTTAAHIEPWVGLGAVGARGRF